MFQTNKYHFAFYKKCLVQRTIHSLSFHHKCLHLKKPFFHIHSKAHFYNTRNLTYCNNCKTTQFHLEYYYLRVLYKTHYRNKAVFWILGLSPCCIYLLILWKYCREFSVEFLYFDIKMAFFFNILTFLYKLFSLSRAILTTFRLCINISLFDYFDLFVEIFIFVGLLIFRFINN